MNLHASNVFSELFYYITWWRQMSFMMKPESILSGSDVVREEFLAPKKLQSQTDHPILWGVSHRCGDRWTDSC